MSKQETTSRRRWWLIAGLAGSLTVLSACAPMGGGWGGGGMGEGRGWGGHHGRGGHGGQMTPEAMNGRIDRMVDRMLSRVDATAEQKQKAATIAKQTAAEMAPLREQHMKARQQAMQLLTAPTVDRAALERIRAEQLQSAEALSRKVTQSLADIAEVLTPEQRAKLGQQMQQMQQHRGRRGPPA